VVYSIQIALELAADNLGAGSIGQADIRQYNDFLHPTMLLDKLMGVGVDPAIAMACIKFHVTLALGDLATQLQPRSRGVLTGSRTAALVAVLPIVDVLENLAGVIPQLGVPLNVEQFAHVFVPQDYKDAYNTEVTCSWQPDYGNSLCVRNWADNIYVFAKSRGGAEEILTCIHEAITVRWRLDLKPTSKQIMRCKAPRNVQEPPEPQGWQMVQQFDTLGHTLEHTGDTKPCMRSTFARAWRAAFCNRHTGLARIGINHKASSFQRAVYSVFNYRALRWHWTKCRAIAMDGLQARLFTCMSAYHGDPASTPYVRNKKIRNILNNALVTRWSTAWAQRTIDWVARWSRRRQLPCAQLLILAYKQNHINAHCRTAQALRGKD
jgi:hypothetical protein